MSAAAAVTGLGCFACGMITGAALTLTRTGRRHPGRLERRLALALLTYAVSRAEARREHAGGDEEEGSCCS